MFGQDGLDNLEAGHGSIRFIDVGTAWVMRV